MDEQAQHVPGAPKVIPIADDDRIDDFGTSSFRSMGYDSLSDNHVQIYKAFKRKKDRLQPGRMTAGERTFVAVLTDLADGKLIEGE